MQSGQSSQSRRDSREATIKATSARKHRERLARARLRGQVDIPHTTEAPPPGITVEAKPCSNTGCWAKDHEGHNLILPWTEFGTDPRTTTGLQSQCKTCMSNYNLVHRFSTPETLRAALEVFLTTDQAAQPPAPAAEALPDLPIPLVNATPPPATAEPPAPAAAPPAEEPSPAAWAAPAPPSAASIRPPITVVPTSAPYLAVTDLAGARWAIPLGYGSTFLLMEPNDPKEQLTIYLPYPIYNRDDRIVLEGAEARRVEASMQLICAALCPGQESDLEEAISSWEGAERARAAAAKEIARLQNAIAELAGRHDTTFNELREARQKISMAQRRANLAEDKTRRTEKSYATYRRFHPDADYVPAAEEQQEAPAPEEPAPRPDEHAVLAELELVT